MKSDDPRQRLLGTWKLIAAVREEIPSGTKTDFLGSSPTGYINYAPDGRMMVLNVGNGRRKPVGANATPAEAEALFRSMTSYGGTYTIDGNEITHHVDVSWNETWTGTKQKRIARFEGNRVYLSTPPFARSAHRHGQHAHHDSCGAGHSAVRLQKYHSAAISRSLHCLANPMTLPCVRRASFGAERGATSRKLRPPGGRGFFGACLTSRSPATSANLCGGFPVATHQFRLCS